MITPGSCITTAYPGRRHIFCQPFPGDSGGAVAAGLHYLVFPRAAQAQEAPD